jgi:putative transposase
VLLDEHADVLRESLRLFVRELMELEVSELIGAELGERRRDDRATHRNGYRQRRWDTRAGEIELRIPKLREGSYFPSFLRPRSEVAGGGTAGRYRGIRPVTPSQLR